MIKVSFRRDSGRIDAFEASGHSSYAPRGYDIVCAAISAISEMLWLGVSRHATVTVSEASDGLMRFAWSESSDPVPAAFAETAFTSVREIAKQYPDHVSVVET